LSALKPVVSVSKTAKVMFESIKKNYFLVKKFYEKILGLAKKF